MINTVSFPGLGIYDITLNRVAFEIGEKPVYWYGIIIAVSFVLAFLFVRPRLRRLGLTMDDLVDALILCIVLGLILGRLYFVVFFEDAQGVNTYFTGTPMEVFRKCIALWEGGCSIYGVIVGALLAFLIIKKTKKIPMGPFWDAAGLGLPIGMTIGRLGNFVNCELYGTVTAPDFFLRMEINGNPGVHPLFLYEMVWNIICFIFAVQVFKKRRFDGQCFIAYIGLYGLGRGFLEMIKPETHMIAHVKISMIVAFACFIFMVVVWIVTRGGRKVNPDKMYVNRLRKAILEAKAAAINTSPINDPLFEAGEGEGTDTTPETDDSANTADSAPSDSSEEI